MLRAAGCDVRFHREFLPNGTLDEDWIPFVAARDWVVITKDRRMRNRSDEWSAFRRAKAVVICFRMKDAKGEELAAALCAAIERIHRLVEKHGKPLLIDVHRGGELRIAYKRDDD